MSTLIIKVSTFITVAGCLCASLTGRAQETVLDRYIAAAFSSNQELKDQQFRLEKAMYALQEARSLFGPQVALLVNYTHAKGGRTIDFPAGDMMNPVYSTLNQLTNSHRFPQMENVSVQLNPENFYDARFRTTLPLLNAEIYYNNRIRKEQVSGQQAAVSVYKRELVKNVKTAYFQYYQATQAVSIYQSAMELIQENIRVNESMVRNGIRNNTALYRSRTEQEKITADINRAMNTQENARAYFNFLLNRQLDSTITLDSTLLQSQALPAESSTARREELEQFKYTANSLRLQEQLQRSYLIPKVGAFLDLGSQGVGKFDNTTRYYLLGVSLEWNLFGSRKYTYKNKQAAMDVKSIDAQAAHTAEQLRLQLYEAQHNYKTVQANYTTAQSQLSFAERYYRDQFKVYKAGQLLYIELLDAQNQLTLARLQTTMAQTAVLTAYAAMERAAAAYPIQQITL